MDNATIVAVVILVGVFLLMAITIIKNGSDAAVQLWGVMGALTGVAFGSITSYYFTNRVNQQQIKVAEAQKEAYRIAYDSVTNSANQAYAVALDIKNMQESEAGRNAIELIRKELGHINKIQPNIIKPKAK